jgi:hypothetical protein
MLSKAGFDFSQTILNVFPKLHLSLRKGEPGHSVGTSLPMMIRRLWDKRMTTKREYQDHEAF